MSEATPKGQRRPTPDDVEPILELIWEGKSLRKACESLGLHVPSTSDLMNSAAHCEQYARAREGRAETLMEEAVSLNRAAALGMTVPGPGGTQSKVDASGAKGFLESAKWATGRMAPKTFGDHRTVQHTGPNGGPIQYSNMSREDRLKRIAELQEKLRASDSSGGD